MKKTEVEKKLKELEIKITVFKYYKLLSVLEEISKRKEVKKNG